MLRPCNGGIGCLLSECFSAYRCKGVFHYSVCGRVACSRGLRFAPVIVICRSKRVSSQWKISLAFHHNMISPTERHSLYTSRAFGLPSSSTCLETCCSSNSHMYARAFPHGRRRVPRHMCGIDAQRVRLPGCVPNAFVADKGRGHMHHAQYSSITNKKLKKFIKVQIWKVE